MVGGRRSDNRIYVHVNPLQFNQQTGKYQYNHATWEAPLTTAGSANKTGIPFEMPVVPRR